MIASIRHAKSHLSELVGAAARGEDVLITNHGRAVARLSAVTVGEVPDAENVLQAMVDEGAVEAPAATGRARRLRPLARLRGGESLTETVAGMRR